MSIIVKINKIVKAQYSEAWSICIWGPPKMTVICGHCSGQFATREYIPMVQTRELMAHCPYCSYWNKTGLQMT